MQHILPTAADHTRFLAFLPLPEKPETGEIDAARLQALRAIGNAGVTLLGGATFEVESVEKNPPLGPRYLATNVIIKGGSCESKRCEIHAGWFNDSSPNHVVVLPAWMGGGRALTFDHTLFFMVPAVTIANERQPMKTSLAMVKDLPGYLYFYIPELRVQGRRVLLHGGEALPFSRPEAPVSPASAPASVAE